ncbi:hypothetical protein D9M68_845330 [compost metagenome]
MLASRPFTNAELRTQLEDLMGRHFAPGDISADRGLIAEAARRLRPSGVCLSHPVEGLMCHPCQCISCTEPATPDPAQAFENALMRLIDESPSTALCVVTGSFVSLTLLLLEANGHKPEGDINIDGGKNRDITIHAEKGL